MQDELLLFLVLFRPMDNPSLKVWSRVIGWSSCDLMYQVSWVIWLGHTAIWYTYVVYSQTPAHDSHQSTSTVADSAAHPHPDVQGMRTIHWFSVGPALVSASCLIDSPYHISSVSLLHHLLGMSRQSENNYVIDDNIIKPAAWYKLNQVECFSKSMIRSNALLYIQG